MTCGPNPTAAAAIPLCERALSLTALRLVVASNAGPGGAIWGRLNEGVVGSDLRLERRWFPWC